MQRAAVTGDSTPVLSLDGVSEQLLDAAARFHFGYPVPGIGAKLKRMHARFGGVTDFTVAKKM